MNSFIYNLYSASHNKTCAGQTNDLNSRLEYHNLGKVPTTKSYRPWELIYFKVFSSKSEAVKRGKWFKFRSGSKKIAEILNISAENSQQKPAVFPFREAEGPTI